MLKKKPNRKRFNGPSLFDDEKDISFAFINLLAETLDVNSAITQLGLTKEQAAVILKSCIPVKSVVSGTKECNEAGHDAIERKRDRDHGRHAAAVISKTAYFINVDGASRGNPGKAGAGAVIKDSDGNVIKELKEYLGIATNNTAEYKALLLALTAAKDLGIRNVRVFADSELMVKQLNGVYRVKSEDLKPFYLKATELIKGFESCKIAHVYREENFLADSLANEAIDSALK